MRRLNLTSRRLRHHKPQNYYPLSLHQNGRVPILHLGRNLHLLRLGLPQLAWRLGRMCANLVVAMHPLRLINFGNNLLLQF